MKKHFKFAAIFVLLISLSFTACEDDNNGNSTTPVIHAIGDTYEGGIVAYILVSGDPGYNPAVQHGLIAATEDQSTGIVWATSAYQSTAVTGTLTTLGTGSANTDNIISQNGAGTTFAAGLARAYNNDGYTDWYLPSKDELNKMYLSRAAIGGFTNACYWSSSEVSTNNVWMHDFGSGVQSCGYGKNNNFRVRAVRAF